MEASFTSNILSLVAIIFIVALLIIHRYQDLCHLASPFGPDLVKRRKHIGLQHAKPLTLLLVDEIVAFICGCLTKKANTGRRTTSSSSYLTLSSSPLHLYLSSRIPPVLSSKAMCSSTFVSDYKLKMRGWWG